MCVLGLRLLPGGGFILAHTRDEELARPTAPPRLPAEEEVLCARDGRGGGTWLGLHRGSRLLAALTNVRRRRAAAAAAASSEAGWASRGQLVLELLRGGAARLEEVRAAALSGGTVNLGREYGPFNLILTRLGGGAGGEGDEDEAYFLTNDHGDAPGAPPLSRASAARLAAGAHAMSNSVLDDESWPKVAFVRAAFGAATLAAPAPVGAPSACAEADGAAATGASAFTDAVAAERALVAAALAQVAPAMVRAEPMPEPPSGCGAGSARDLSWSPLSPEAELALQRHVRVPRMQLAPPGPGAYGSRSATVVLRLPGARAAWFCHASFDDEGGGEEERARREAGDGAECDFIVAGERFRAWRA